MRIAFVVNRVETELVDYTTTRLALAALRRGHDIWYMGSGDFIYDPRGTVQASAVRPAGRGYKSLRTFLEAVQGPDAVRETLDVEALDVLLLRNDPAQDQVDRPWAQSAGIVFGQVVASRGVMVLNDPMGLFRALNKMYLQLFPEEVRPRTLITRDSCELRAFAKAHRKGGVVLKPLQGSGGQSVFLVKGEDLSNLNQIIEAVQRFGYVIAQEYLPEAAKKDTRLFLLNGAPLQVDGTYCAFSRVGADGDLRTNMSAGGRPARARVTPRMLEIAEIVRPRLVQDGMFLVGLDVAGDKLMEINVFSPGGVGIAGEIEGVDFLGPVLDALEAKVEHRAQYGVQVANAELATL